MNIQVKVTPNSRNAEVIQKGALLLVKVKELPKEGKANAAVIKAVAKYYGVPPGCVRIVSGHTSRNKIIEIARAD